MPHVSHTAVMWKSKYLNPQTSLGARNMKRSAVFSFFLIKKKAGARKQTGESSSQRQPDATSETVAGVCQEGP